MKILVTLGTTKFDSLIEYIDKNISNENYNITLQIADGIYKPKNFNYFTYKEDIEKYYKESDIIICHAGAGTIYRLLELKKKIIIVPNLDRIDNHQSDIATFMSKNNFALALEKYNELDDLLLKINNTSLEIFKKESFFKAQEIIDFIVS